MESTGPEAARKQLVAVETELCKTWVSNSLHELFSGFCIINAKTSCTHL